jgi:hypothetical protein
MNVNIFSSMATKVLIELKKCKDKYDNKSLPCKGEIRESSRGLRKPTNSS